MIIKVCPYCLEKYTWYNTHESLDMALANHLVSCNNMKPLWDAVLITITAAIEHHLQTWHELDD